MSSNKFINEDTYQTLQDIQIKQDPSKPIWVNQTKTENKKYKYTIMVATPVHSEVSMHYFQACLEFQKQCFKNNIGVMFQIMKSSLVTQGRNLCVSSFLSREECTHLLFIDSDIDFKFSSILAMLEADKELISVPYPLKTINWDKALSYIKKGKIKTAQDLQNATLMFPLRLPNHDNVNVKKGVIEVTHSPTGCMLIKKSLFHRMIEKYPDHKIVQKTVINGVLEDKENMWNFFDTLHDPENKTYLGEDFAFCKRWRDIGGKCYAYIDEYITHVGEHQYCGRLRDELISVDIDN